MAKQRGPHQIKGKINNLSYYEQKNIRGGLIRRINEGMSSRLKSDPTFSNTRTANVFFGVCSRFASLLISIVSLRWGTLTRGNRQSILTRGMWSLFQIEYDRKIFEQWDNSMFFWRYFSYVFNQIVRTPLDRFISSVPNFVNAANSETINITLTSRELIRIREYYGVGALEISILSPCLIGPVVYIREVGKYEIPSVDIPNRPTTVIYNQLQGDLDLSFSVTTVDDSPQFAFISIRPIQNIEYQGTYSVFPNKGLLKCICVMNF